MKPWLIVGLLVAGILQAVPKHADQTQTNQGDSKSLSDKAPKPATGGTENVVSSGPSPKKEENGTNSKVNQSDWREKLISPLISNWPLVAVAIWGTIIAIRTLNTIKEQTQATRIAAEATNRSVELQSVQWVTLKNWRTRLSQPYMLNVEVDLINETSFPLTLRGTTFQVGTAKFEGALDITVVPHALHAVGCIRQLLQEEYTNYLSDNGITFGLRGAIRFVGVSGNKVQPFGGLVTTSFSGGTEFSSISEYEQSAKDHYGEESAN